MYMITAGEYYRVQYSYCHNEEITRGGQNFKIETPKNVLIACISSIYNSYNHFGVEIEVVTVKAIQIPLEIKPSRTEFNLAM